MGSVTTDAFVAPAESLWVNYLALVPGSSLAVEVLSDDGKLLASSSAMPAGDQPRAQVRWSSGRNVTAGERIQLRFVLSRGAKIYSWWIA